MNLCALKIEKIEFISEFYVLFFKEDAFDCLQKNTIRSFYITIPSRMK